MISLIKYAFRINLGLPYLLMSPIIFLGDAPLYVSILAYLTVAPVLLAVAAALRRYERKNAGKIRPTFYESAAKALAHVPRVIGTPRRPSVVGVIGAKEYWKCYYLAARLDDGSVTVMVVSSRGFRRLRLLESFESEGEWRRWARRMDARYLPEGRYTDAVYEQVFKDYVDLL